MISFFQSGDQVVLASGVSGLLKFHFNVHSFLVKDFCLPYISELMIKIIPNLNNPITTTSQ